MNYTFRPAKRENTPLIIGIGGPTKSGKTYSAHRLASGLADGGTVAMINCEGKRGHQYADKFKYIALDLSAPFSPAVYTKALEAAAQIKPACLIIDSMSHMHDGPGGMIEYHESELDRMAGTDYKKRERCTWTAWIKPKREENEFIYALLSLSCHVVLCFRAKEKIKIVKGKEPLDLGWQAISSDRVSFETIFTVMLPPHCKGVPDLSISDMREPFDAIIPKDKPIDEELGRQLFAWSKGKITPELSAAFDSLKPLEDFREKILACSTEAELEKLVPLAKTLTPEQQVKARECYRTKLSAIRDQIIEDAADAAANEVRNKMEAEQKDDDIPDDGMKFDDGGTNG